MRLQLIVCALLVSAPAFADDAFVAKTQVYVDTDHTTIVSPLVRASKDVWKGGTASIGFVADIVSSASIDVVSAATAHMSDFRKEVSASLSQAIGDTTLSGGYIYSTENDYQSHNISLGVTQDLLQKNVTLDLSYAGSFNDVGRSGDPTFHKSLQTHTLAVGYTQVLGPKTLGAIGYELGYNRGYMASPYRFVHIDSADDVGADFKVPETDPPERLRHAIVVSLVQHLFEATSIAADYRLYLDDWGIQSHTAQVRYTVTFGPVELRLRGRFYFQTQASFYQPDYQTLQTWVTVDRELSELWSVLGGAKLTVHVPGFGNRLDLEAKADLFYFHYDNFPLLSDRFGSDLGVGLALAY